MLLYTDTNGGNAESSCQAPPITIQLGAFNAGGFHSLVASLVGAIQNNMLDSRVNPTNRVSHRGMRKTGRKNEPEEPRHEHVYKNRPTHGMIAGLLSPSGVWALPFFLSLSHPKPLHRRYLNMSGANVLAGAHHFVANNSTFNSANTVSKMVIVSMYQRTKLIVRISRRCTSTTSTTAIGRRSMGSFPSRQTQAIDSQGGPKSFPN